MIKKIAHDVDLFAGFDPEEMGLVVMTGFDDCVVGVVEQFGKPPVVCYSKPRVLLKLMHDGLSPEEAEEFWAFNQIGSYIGESTPCFLSPNNTLVEKEK